MPKISQTTKVIYMSWPSTIINTKQKVYIITLLSYISTCVSVLNHKREFPDRVFPEGFCNTNFDQ